MLNIGVFFTLRSKEECKTHSTQGGTAEAELFRPDTKDEWAFFIDVGVGE